MIVESAQLRVTSWKIPFVSRIRFQLLGAIAVCVALPGLIRWPGTLFVTQDLSLSNTAIGCALAIVFGFLLLKRVNDYPQFNAVINVFMSMALPFGLLALVFFALRFDYSRFVFLSSFSLSILWFVTISYMERTYRSSLMVVVPGGDLSGLGDVAGLRFAQLSHPIVDLSTIAGVVVDLRYSHQPRWEKFITDCTLTGIPVYHTKQLVESLSGKVDIEHLSENSFGSLLPNLLYLRIKQGLDIGLVIALSPLLMLAIAFVSTVIFFKMGRPIFFVQKRTGYRGKSFRMYKFRTMRNTSPLDFECSALTSENDVRITGLGAVLRKFRLDELPQVLNILKGEMSWIGPRPEAASLTATYERELPFYRYRHVVRPGISGWAQISQGHVTETSDVLGKLHYDFFYIKHLSPWLDILIALKTLRTIFSGFGAK